MSYIYFWLKAAETGQTRGWNPSWHANGKHRQKHESFDADLSMFQPVPVPYIHSLFSWQSCWRWWDISGAPPISVTASSLGAILSAILNATSAISFAILSSTSAVNFVFLHRAMFWSHCIFGNIVHWQCFPLCTFQVKIRSHGFWCQCNVGKVLNQMAFDKFCEL